jgi:hypothetical protein
MFGTTTKEGDEEGCLLGCYRMIMDIDRCFRGAYCLHHQGDLMMETENISKTPVNYKVTKRKFAKEKLRNSSK